MRDSAIAITSPQPLLPQSPPWYPFAELAPALELLDRACAGLNDDVRRVIREGGATIDALIAETEQAFAELRHAHQITRELDDKQTAEVLRGIREHASGKQPVGFQPPGGTA